MTSSLRHLGSVACISILISACASQAVDPRALLPALTPEQSIALASEASGGGNAEKALSILADAKHLSPANKELWLKSAQINFDRSNYVQAIADAQQVLERDGFDKVAQGIIVVSGLRLSTKAISELVKLESLDGSTRGEAEKLARSLRESLGEIVLVPTPSSSPAPASTGNSPARGSSAAARAKAAKAAAAAAAADNAEGAKPAKSKDQPACPPGNPFCGL